MVWSRAMRRCVGLAEPCREKYSGGQVMFRQGKARSRKVQCSAAVVQWSFAVNVLLRQCFVVA